MELVNREKQQKLNELDVVIPFRLHQVNRNRNSSEQNTRSTKQIQALVNRIVSTLCLSKSSKNKAKFAYTVQVGEPWPETKAVE